MKKALSEFKIDDIQKLQKNQKQNKLVLGFLSFVAAGCVFNAIALPKQPKPQIIGQLAIAGLSLLTAAYWIKSNEENYLQLDVFTKLNREVFKSKMRQSFDRQIKTDNIEHELILTNTLVQNLPSYAVLKYARDYGITGLLPQTKPTDNYEEHQERHQISLTADIKHLEEKHEIDLSWVDSEFINSSKVVVGGRGSGKSTYLRYEASRWLIENPDGILIICDPHYDIDDPSKWWLNDIPQSEVYGKFVFKKTEDIVKKIREVYRNLTQRIDGNIKKYPKIKIIFDEEENHKRRASKDDFQDFLSFTECVQDEGRKFFIELTISMHSMKKENTGIDSAALQQMNWLLFEKACYDATTKFPADFDQKAIKDAARILSNSLPKEAGRTVVVIRQDYNEPLITVLPYIKPAIITIEQAESLDSVDVDFDQEDVDSITPESKSEDAKEYYKMMVDWVKLCLDEYNRYPTAAHIKEQWEKLTGKEISETALLYLIDKLFDEIK